jgi:glycosyltransferase involved in cell wall biosynthesis
MRVLHLPTSVGGNAWNLAQGEKALGLNSEVLVAVQNWLDYSADIVLDSQGTASRYRRAWRSAREFLRIRSAYDVFHFNFGSSLFHTPRFHLNLLDLPFYPKNAKLFVTYNGCDARQKFPTISRTGLSACHEPKCYHGMCEFGRYDEFRRRAIAKMARYARHMWALNPDLLYFLPPEKSSFLPYAVALEEPTPTRPRFEGRLRFLHAPTNREFKGSRYVLDAFERARRSRGDDVELILVENLRHREALSRYRDADVVIDQVLLGWYGGFAVEAMKMGKPVIARIAEEDLHFIPEAMARDVRETVINAGPNSLYDAILRCVDDRQFLRERAAASLEYANRWHDPKFVAALTKEKYEAA